MRTSNQQPVTSNQIDIDYVAKLANLPLTHQEKVTFERQLGDILTYFNKLGEADTKNVEPIGHITGLTNISRADETAPSLSQEDALKNAPKTRNGFIEVKAIFGNED